MGSYIFCLYLSLLSPSHFISDFFVAFCLFVSLPFSAPCCCSSFFHSFSLCVVFESADSVTLSLCTPKSMSAPAPLSQSQCRCGFNMITGHLVTHYFIVCLCEKR